MFLRKKKKSGIISAQSIDKSYIRYKSVKTIGSSEGGSYLYKVVQQQQEYVSSEGSQQQIDFILGDDQRYF